MSQQSEESSYIPKQVHCREFNKDNPEPAVEQPAKVDLSKAEHQQSLGGQEGESEPAQQKVRSRTMNSQTECSSYDTEEIYIISYIERIGEESVLRVALQTRMYTVYTVVRKLKK